jgi:hypothetical protein
MPFLEAQALCDIPHCRIMLTIRPADLLMNSLPMEVWVNFFKTGITSGMCKFIAPRLEIRLASRGMDLGRIFGCVNGPAALSSLLKPTLGCE